jgi:hypothetical protein
MMITTSQFFVLLLATLSFSFPMTAVMGQQTVSSAAPAPPPSSTPADFIEWRSPLFGVVISHPPDWEIRPPYNSPRGYSLAQFFSPEGEQGVFTEDRPNFNVEIAEEVGAMADNEARAWLEQRGFELMTMHENFQIIESVPTTLAGLPAWMIRYTFTSMIDGSVATHMQVMGGVAGRTYLLTYSSPANLFDEYLSDGQNMIDSFRIESRTTPSTTTTTPSPPSSSTTSFQVTNDSFSVQIPQGWVIQDLNNTGTAVSEEARVGYGLLAQLCTEEQQGEQQGRAISFNASGDIANNTSSDNSCQTTQEEVIHVIRYPDLLTKIQPANNITAYHLEKLREVGYNNIQTVNTTNLTVNVTNPLTNETLTTEPAKFVEMTYSVASAPGEPRRGYFILTATNWTAPNAGTIKGYSLFYEGHSTNSSAAARPNITTTSSSASSDSLAQIPLVPPAVEQLFDTFELIVAPEVAQLLAQQGPTQGQAPQVTNSTGTNATQIAVPSETSETEEVDDGDNGGVDGGDDDNGDGEDGGDEEPPEEEPPEEEPPEEEPPEEEPPEEEPPEEEPPEEEPDVSGPDVDGPDV